MAKIEKNNIVEGSQTAPKPLKEKTKQVKEGIETEAEKLQTEKKTDDNIENEENVDTTEIVKELEGKIYSCSECGFKTHSRMTYIQHVLNGCIMDMVLGEVRQLVCRSKLLMIGVQVDNESPVAESPGRGRAPAKRGRKPGLKPSSDGAMRKRQRADE